MSPYEALMRTFLVIRHGYNVAANFYRCVCVCVCARARASERTCNSHALLYTASEDLRHRERKYVLFLELVTPHFIALSGQLRL
jgi:hypothetical protein